MKTLIQADEYIDNARKPITFDLDSIIYWGKGPAGIVATFVDGSTKHLFVDYDEFRAAVHDACGLINVKSYPSK